MTRAAQLLDGGRLLSLLGAKHEVLDHFWMLGEVHDDALLNHLDFLLDRFSHLVQGGDGRVVRVQRRAVEHETYSRGLAAVGFTLQKPGGVFNITDIYL